jgi:hypothetical protein
MDLIPLGKNDKLAFVVRDGCGNERTFEASNSASSYIRENDQHHMAYDHTEKRFGVEDLEWQGLAAFDLDFCPYLIHIFPTPNLEREYVTFRPALYTLSAAVVFTVIFIMSIAYERRVEQMNENAIKYRRAIVSNLIPAVVRDSLFCRRVDGRIERNKSKRGNRRLATKFEEDLTSHGNPRDEVAEAIVMPEFDSKKARKNNDHALVELPPHVLSQLHDYITTLFAMYRGNPFHKFRYVHNFRAPKLSEPFPVLKHSLFFLI